MTELYIKSFFKLKKMEELWRIQENYDWARKNDETHLPRLLNKQGQLNLDARSRARERLRSLSDDHVSENSQGKSRGTLVAMHSEI